MSFGSTARIYNDPKPGTVRRQPLAAEVQTAGFDHACDSNDAGERTLAMVVTADVTPNDQRIIIDFSAFAAYLQQYRDVDDEGRPALTDQYNA